VKLESNVRFERKIEEWIDFLMIDENFELKLAFESALLNLYCLKNL
jgi:hypothetical protein